MLFQVRIERRAEKELAKIPKKYQDKVLAVLPLLAANPYIGKKLKGELTDTYSYRVWPYRILYRIYKNLLLVIVIRIGHRQGVY